MVLVVDNNALFRTALAANLRDDGYHVLEFENGATLPVDALAKADAVLIEYSLKGESGSAIIDRVRCLHPSLPIIVITRAAGELRQRLSQGNIAVLPKPLDYNTLAGELRRLLKQDRRTI